MNLIIYIYQFGNNQTEEKKISQKCLNVVL